MVDTFHHSKLSSLTTMEKTVKSIITHMISDINPLSNHWDKMQAPNPWSNKLNNQRVYFTALWSLNSSWTLKIHNFQSETHGS